MSVRERVERPWGYYEVLASGDGWQVKRLVVGAGEMTSLQVHKDRTEELFPVGGIGFIRVGDRRAYARIGEQLHVPAWVVHQIEGASYGELEVIEIQHGDIDEDDIIRIEDRYGRAQ